jgi:hypothetical protein
MDRRRQTRHACADYHYVGRRAFSFLHGMLLQCTVFQARKRPAFRRMGQWSSIPADTGEYPLIPVDKLLFLELQ